MGKSEEWNPGKIFEISGYYWKTCALHAGVELDLFTAIGDGGATAREIADKRDLDERATAMLLNALAAMDLLIKSEDRYANVPSAAVLLVKDSPRYIGYMIRHHHHLVSAWSKLDKAVKSGGPVKTRPPFEDEEERESFLMGMFNLAMGIAPDVAGRIDLSKRKRLLDLGGGPGTYAIHFCKENPTLSATIYDLATTRPFAQKTIRRFALEDRIAFTEGNYLEDEVPKGFDAAWLSHTLHGEGIDDCRKLIAKAAAALEPGGVIMIHDFILDDNLASPLFPALFSLNMLVATPGGQAWSESQIAEMLQEAGFNNVRRLDFTGPNDSGIMTGVV